MLFYILYELMFCFSQFNSQIFISILFFILMKNESRELKFNYVRGQNLRWCHINKCGSLLAIIFVVVRIYDFFLLLLFLIVKSLPSDINNNNNEKYNNNSFSKNYNRKCETRLIFWISKSVIINYELRLYCVLA